MLAAAVDLQTETDILQPAELAAVALAVMELVATDQQT